jgi:hypothetical protein
VGVDAAVFEVVNVVPAGWEVLQGSETKVVICDVEREIGVNEGTPAVSALLSMVSPEITDVVVGIVGREVMFAEDGTPPVDVVFKETCEGVTVGGASTLVANEEPPVVVSKSPGPEVAALVASWRRVLCCCRRNPSRGWRASCG